MTLHCFYALHDALSVRTLLASAAPTDSVVLLGNACVMARQESPALEEWLRGNLTLFVLAEDIAAYGVEPVHSAVEVIDYADWVNLATRHRNQQVWR